MTHNPLTHFRCGCDRSPENTGKRSDGQADFCRRCKAAQMKAYAERTRVNPRQALVALLRSERSRPRDASGRSYALAPVRDVRETV